MNPFVKEENKQDSKNDDSMMISTLEAMKKANKER